jgi:hypothetical protein
MSGTGGRISILEILRYTGAPLNTFTKKVPFVYGVNPCEIELCSELSLQFVPVDSVDTATDVYVGYFFSYMPLDYQNGPLSLVAADSEYTSWL